MSTRQLNVEAVTVLAAVRRLLRRAAVLAWDTADAEGPGSRTPLFALGVDLAADTVQLLLVDHPDLDGDVPLRGTAVTLLRDAERQLAGIPLSAEPAALHVLRAEVAALLREAEGCARR